MIVSGLEVVERSIKVDVPDNQIIEAAIALLRKKYPVIDEFDHIEKGWLMKVSYISPHNGDYDYEKIRQATGDEAKAFLIRDELLSLQWLK